MISKSEYKHNGRLINKSNDIIKQNNEDKTEKFVARMNPAAAKMKQPRNKVAESDTA